MNSETEIQGAVVATAAKPTVKARLIEEAMSYLFVSGYLLVFLSALTTYRQLVQMEYGVGYVQYGFCLVEALVLGKLIIIGRVMKVGERFRDRPLIVPVLYKTLCFGVLVVLFSIAEHTAAGLWHHEGASAIAQRIVRQGKWEILCRMVMLVMALAPMFAMWEVGRAVGEEHLSRLFFRGRAGAQAGGANRTD